MVVTNYNCMHKELSVSCGCKTWYVTQEEHRLRGFENKVMWKIFGPRGGGSMKMMENTA
jgi:hypothetical protein